MVGTVCLCRKKNKYFIDSIHMYYILSSFLKHKVPSIPVIYYPAHNHYCHYIFWFYQGARLELALAWGKSKEKIIFIFLGIGNFLHDGQIAHWKKLRYLSVGRKNRLSAIFPSDGRIDFTFYFTRLYCNKNLWKSKDLSGGHAFLI